jgi:hypothetical protein
MKRLIAYTLVTCGILTAQQSRKDERPEATGLARVCTDLSPVMSTAVPSPVKQQAAEDIMALSEKAHQPPRTLVQEFADDLTNALAGKSGADRKLVRQLAMQELVRQLATDILKVLQSAGTSTAGFHETVDDAQEALTGLGVSTPQAQKLASLLRAIGEKELLPLRR